jgi:phosphoglycerate dehydrogenase-like enzyme
VLRILVHVPHPALERFAAEHPEVELLEIPRKGEIPAEARGEVLLTLPWGTPNLGEALERGVRWIHVVGTGVDRFPLDLVGDRVLSCARGASAVPIAEWVLAVMLAFEKHLPEAWLDAPPERWNWAELGGLEGRSLGLVGIGGIGQAVARRALPFGLRVLALRRSAAAMPLPGVERAADLRELVAQSDHLVVAASATPETRHLIGREALAAARPGLHLVNVARGSLVDQEALREELDAGRVARASLDTVEPEPLPEGHWLYRHPAVRLSAHISWSMPDALDRLYATFIANLRHHLAGEPLEGVVDPKRGY